MAGIKDVAAIVKNQVTNLSQKKAETLVITVLDAVKEAALEHNRLILRDFATIDIVETAAHEVRNLHTGERTMAGPSKRVRFRAATTFKAQAKTGKVEPTPVEETIED